MYIPLRPAVVLEAGEYQAVVKKVNEQNGAFTSKLIKYKGAAMRPVVVCEVVAGWVAAGSFDLDELKAHVETCDVCRAVMGASCFGVCAKWTG